MNNNIKLFVATPVYGNMCTGSYALSIFKLGMVCVENNIPIQLDTIYNDALITRARNILVDNFLNSDCSHLLFIDSDISFEVDHVFSMLNCDLDVIGGLYPQKSIDWNLIKNAVLDDVPVDQLKYCTGYLNFNNINKIPSFNINEPLEVRHVPTGFMMIKREVFEKLNDITPSYNVYDNTDTFQKTVKAYFDTSISNNEFGIYNSEDWHFCDQWRGIGGKVYLAPWVQLTHYGTYAFQGAAVPFDIYK